MVLVERLLMLVSGLVGLVVMVLKEEGSMLLNHGPKSIQSEENPLL